MPMIDVVYEGDLHASATHVPSGATLATDAPRDNEGRGESFSPTDLVATALGSCMLTIMGIVARRHDLDIEGSKARVKKHMSADPVRRIGTLEVSIELPESLTEEQRKLLEHAALGCPVKGSLHPDVLIPVTFIYA